MPYNCNQICLVFISRSLINSHYQSGRLWSCTYTLALYFSIQTFSWDVSSVKIHVFFLFRTRIKEMEA